MKKFKVGMRVTITNKLEGSATEALYKLDRIGNMLKMQGNSYIISAINLRNIIKVKCPEAKRSYSFNEEDITHYEEKLPPNEFKFNENLLDV